MAVKYGFLKEETTRKRSSRQESRLSKVLRGKTTINSGATFGQNDVIGDFYEIEAKTTAKDSFSLTLKDLRILRHKCSVNKVPIFVVNFEKSKNGEYAIIPFDDLKMLIDVANAEK